MLPSAEALARHFIDAGMPCEIEAATRGVIVYASSHDDVERIAKKLLLAVRSRDPRVIVTPACEDVDEDQATRWWAAVEFDWRKF